MHDDRIGDHYDQVMAILVWLFRSLCAKEGSLDISDESFVCWQEASMAQ